MLTRSMIKKRNLFIYGFFSLALISLMVSMKSSKREIENGLLCTVEGVFKDSGFNPLDTKPLYSFDQIFNESIEHFKISEVYKNKYDNLIDKKGSFKKLLLSETYSKLLLLRESQEELHDEFRNVVKIEVEKKKLENLSNNELNIMFDVIEKLKSLIQEKIKSDLKNTATIELSLSHYTDELDDKMTLLKKCLKRKGTFSDYDSIPIDEREINRQKVLNRKELVKKAKNNESLNAENLELNRESRFHKEIEKNWKEKQKDFKALLSANRNPADAIIYPSAGKAGNMFGLDFPENTYALTFDDGPGETTVGVLDHLKIHGLKATFFVLSKQILDSAFPKFALLEQEDGHAIGSHSYTHANMPKISSSAQNHEIVDAAKVFESRFGFKPKYFRLPYGAGVSISSIRQKIADAGMIHVFWTVDTLDWQDKDPDSIMDRTLKQMKQYKRGIILFHDIHPQSVIASEMLMSYFNDPINHIRSVTIPEIVDELNGLTPHHD